MASCAIVRTRRTTKVSLPFTSGSLPAPGHRVELSPFDTRWVNLPPHDHVLLYPAPEPAAATTFPDIVRSLKSSLAEVLPAFHPLAGELTYSPESRALAIVCGADAHVAFVEAETDMELGRLVEEDAHDVAAFKRLVPDILREELPAPVLAVQVTEFVGGGVAVGVAMNHVSMDGRGFFRFLDTWAAVTLNNGEGETGRKPAEDLVLHDRRLLRAFEYDGEEVGLYLEQFAPHLPKMVRGGDHAPPLSCRTFTFTAPALRHLKQQLVAATAATKPSTFAALGAHAWVSIARCRGLTGDSAPVVAIFPADCRSLMSPPVPDGYTGNCVATIRVALSGEELGAPDGLARAFVTITKGITDAKRDPLANWRRWFVGLNDIVPGRFVLLTGSPRLPAYGVDFGFGRPARSELASIHRDNQVVMFAARDPGSVQASVAIAGDRMPALCELFMIHD